jgi:hypothetical protein
MMESLRSGIVATLVPILCCTFTFLLLTGTGPALAWTVAAGGGFGNPGYTTATAMAVYGSRLYVGTDIPSGGGCEIWSIDGLSWTREVGQGAAGSPTGPGFGNPRNQGLMSMAVFGAYLYAGTYNDDGCQVWRYDGSAWTQVVGQGTGGASTAPGFGTAFNRSIYAMAAYGPHLYAGTLNANGCEVWRYDGATWEWMVGYGATNTPTGAGFGNTNSYSVESMAVYGSHLYAGTHTYSDGCEIWRYDGAAWTPVVGDSAAVGNGFGNPNNDFLMSMSAYGPYLYAGTSNFTNGCEVWRYNGSSWTPVMGGGAVVGNGFGDPLNKSVESMQVYESRLCVGTVNQAFGNKGCEVWAYDGAAWAKVVGAGLSGSDARGFGSPNNLSASSMGVLNSCLYVGTWNPYEGCAVCVDGFPTWYLAEGSTGGDMETWVLVQNPGAAEVHVNLKFQTDTGEQSPPALQNFAIPPTSRRSFKVNTYVPDNFNVSTKVEATDGNVICERAMYGGNKTWAHDSIGTTTPAPTWYLAEGSTGGDMETWVLVQNPGAAEVHVNLKFQTDTGEQSPPALQNFAIPPTSRRSFKVNTYVPDNFNVSTKVEATDGNVICERAMYGGNKTWAHDSIGVP